MDREKVVEIFSELRNFADNDVHPVVSPENWPVYSKLRDLIDQAEEDALAMLKEQEAVVRCKDCKHWRQLYGDKPFYSSIGCCDCDDMWRSLDGETAEVNDIRTDSDFYCGYADRR